MGNKLRWAYSELHAYADLIDERPLIFPVFCIMFSVILALAFGMPEARVNRGLILGVATWMLAAAISLGAQRISHTRFPSAHVASAVVLTFSAAWAWPWFTPVAGAMVFFTMDGRVRLHRHTPTEAWGGFYVGFAIIIPAVIIIGL